MLRINHFCSRLDILDTGKAIAALNDGVGHIALTTIMKLMDGKTFSIMHKIKKENLDAELYLLISIHGLCL